MENPKMELDFQPSEGAAVPGRVSLYGKNLNPAEDDTPILAKDMPASGVVSFTPEEMDAAVRQILARNGKDTSALKDTTLNFNVVASAGDKEAFVSGFSYRRAGAIAGFARLEGSKPGSFGSYKSRFGLPKAVKGFSGRMGIYGIGLGIDYIFIPGSPYHADIDKKDSSFTVPQMGEGRYTVIGADKDSAQLFESTDTLNTADTAYSAKTWSTITFIPDK